MATKVGILGQAAWLIEGIEASRCGVISLRHTVNHSRRSELVLSVFAHSHIKLIQIFIFFICGFELV